MVIASVQKHASALSGSLPFCAVHTEAQLQLSQSLASGVFYSIHFLPLFFSSYFDFKCLGVLPVCMYVHTHTHLGTGIIDNCELPCEL